MSEILVNTIKKADGTGSITVPADTGTVLTTATAASSIPGYGNVTMVDQWRLTTDVSSDVVLTSLEQVDQNVFGNIGTAMSVSSGVFTFPETGIYLVIAYGLLNVSANDYVSLITEVTPDNSTFSTYSDAANLNRGSTTSVAQVSSVVIIDVTDTTQVKVRFKANSVGAGSNFVGDTLGNDTYFTFIRLGDT